MRPAPVPSSHTEPSLLQLACARILAWPWGEGPAQGDEDDKLHLLFKGELQVLSQSPSLHISLSLSKKRCREESSSPLALLCLLSFLKVDVKVNLIFVCADPFLYGYTRCLMKVLAKINVHNQCSYMHTYFCYIYILQIYHAAW
jgi:hypothetical protein